MKVRATVAIPLHERVIFANGCEPIAAGADSLSPPKYAAGGFRENLLRRLAANRNPESYIADGAVTKTA